MHAAPVFSATAHPPFTAHAPVTGGRGARVSITTLTKSSLEANDARDQSVSEVSRVRRSPTMV